MPPLSRRFSILSSSSASASSSSVCTTFSTFSQKSVQFVVDFDVRNTTHVYSTEGVTTDELWYVTADYDQMKRATRDHGDDLQEEGFDEVLEEAYGDNATEEEDSIQRSLNDFCKLTQGRGIEKYISLSHWKERSASRKHSIHAVLKAQQKAKDEGKLSGDALEEHLREMYLHKTVVASTFARRMGQADQKAASQTTTRTPVARTKSATDKLISAAKSLVSQPQSVAMQIHIPLQIVALNA